MDIDQTFGAFLVGTLVGVMLYGMTILQTYQYFRNYPEDCTANKVLVSVLGLIETFHTVICAHACYYYLVTSVQNPEAYALGVWSINVAVAVSGVVIILGQRSETPTCSIGARTNHEFLMQSSNSYFARRIYLIGPSLRALVLFATVLLIGEQGVFIAATVQAFLAPEFVHFQKFTWLISAGTAMAVVADGLLTSVLVTVLRRNMTGMKRMDTIVDILILYAVSTGLLTSVVNFFSFLFSLVSPSKLIYTAFGIVATKLYANSLLAALNSRKYLSQRATGGFYSSSLIDVRATRALAPAHDSFTLVSPGHFRMAPQYNQTPPASPGYARTPRTGSTSSESSASSTPAPRS